MTTAKVTADFRPRLAGARQSESFFGFGANILVKILTDHFVASCPQDSRCHRLWPHSAGDGPDDWPVSDVVRVSRLSLSEPMAITIYYMRDAAQAITSKRSQNVSLVISLVEPGNNRKKRQKTQ